MSKEVGVLRFGSKERPNSIKWWAELGRIHYQDDDTGRYGSLSCEEFVARLQALHAFNGRGRSVNAVYDATERARIQRFISNAEALVNKATREQGDPDDPRVRAARKEARPRPVSMVQPVRSSLILPASYQRPDPIMSILQTQNGGS